MTLAAYGFTAPLMELFRRREVEALGPFGYYCIGAGLVSLLLLLARFAAAGATSEDIEREALEDLTANDLPPTS